VPGPTPTAAAVTARCLRLSALAQRLAPRVRSWLHEWDAVID